MSTTFKVVLLGEGRVGKTSLISRFVKDQFDSEEASTVQANMYNKKKVTVDGRNVDLSIWDTAGQERFHALGPIYYRNSNGAVLVYDVTDADTFEKVKMWIKELKAVVGDTISIVICGNKADMEKDRDIDQSIAEKYAAKENALHFNTSAKLNLNVSEAFEGLARAIIAQECGSGGGGATGSGGIGSSTRRKKKGLQIDETSGSGNGRAPAAASTGSSAKTEGGTTATGNSDTTAYNYNYDYDAPPAAGGGGGQRGDEGGQATKPRKNTIILSSSSTETSKPAGSGGDGGGGGGGTTTKKKKGGCCS